MIVLLSVLGIIAAIAVAAWWLSVQLQRFSGIAGEAAAARAGQEFERARQTDVHAMSLDQQKVEGAIVGLKEQLEKYERMVRDFERDRDQKYGKLEHALKDVVTRTDQLGQTTSSLAAVLGNSRVRGQWGQKMADDVLRECGLLEGIQYVREKEFAAGRPDYTFMLPDNHKLFMDVKFPIDNYLRFSQGAAADQERAKDQFVRDVREHLKTMERRDYVTHEDGSLDYIVIFIPNEQVYGAANEWMPGLIDECLKKRMILCGPWTLYAILRIIWQAWQNYNYSLAIRDIIKTINGFMQDYGKFKERFEDLGKQMEKATLKYQEISGTSYRRLDSRIQHIEGYRKGHQIPEELPDPEALIPSPLTTGEASS